MMNESLGYSLLKSIYHRKLRSLLVDRINTGDKELNINSLNLLDMTFHYDKHYNSKGRYLNHGI